MVADLEDHVFGLLLRTLAPLVMAPPGPLPPTGPQLRGVVRLDDIHARVMFCDGAAIDSGVGFQIALSKNGRQIAVDVLVDWLRTESASVLRSRATSGSITRDCHNNLIIDTNVVGFSEINEGKWYDQNLFSLLSILIHGGGYPWFESTYVCMGFILGGTNTCRIYIRPAESTQVLGIQIPLTDTNGQTMYSYGSLPQELVPLIRGGGIQAQPKIDGDDDYCTAVFDLTSWFGRG